MVQAVEHLHCKYEALRSNPNSTKKKKKKLNYLPSEGEF
jgi:hypothetical protein